MWERDIWETDIRETDIPKTDIGETVTTCRFAEYLLLHIDIRDVSLVSFRVGAAGRSVRGVISPKNSSPLRV
jgi:hypothetical protein